MDNPRSASNAPHVCVRRQHQWEGDYTMNKLNFLENMGFKISWKLIYIGLFGDDEIPVSLTHNDVIEYLDSLLTDLNEQTDNIITLICEKDDCEEDECEKFDRLLKKLANEDDSSSAIQKRKWRAYLLKNVIDNISEDWLQGLLELTEFWMSMGMLEDCPLTFPSSDNEKSVQDYYSPSSYEFNLNKNQEWLNKEILSIVKLED